MTTYREFQAELERLYQSAESARLKEKREALERIQALIAEHALTPADLGFDDDAKPKQGAAKYRDPESGKTWSGKGRAPAWIAGRNRDDFAIG